MILPPDVVLSAGGRLFALGPERLARHGEIPKRIREKHPEGVEPDERLGARFRGEECGLLVANGQFLAVERPLFASGDVARPVSAPPPH